MEQQLKTLITQLKKMRQLQKAFFSNRAKPTERTALIQEAKKQEAIVDVYLSTLEHELNSKQQNLIDFQQNRQTLQTSHY